MNGADVLCQGLLAHDIDVCFANPGTSEMHFVAALDRQPKMRCILGLFEGVVTGAADGYARMADRPAATLLHTGPGLANGLANLHNARRANTPMINIVGDHASYHLAYDAPLSSDIESLAAPMSNWLGRVKDPNDIGPTLENAIVAAHGIPGVSTLILPANAAWDEAVPFQFNAVGKAQKSKVDEQKIFVAAKTIRSKRGRCGIILGGRGLRTQALALAGKIAALYETKLFSPVLLSRMERGSGRVAVNRVPYPIDIALEVLKDIDVLILLGAKAPVAFFAYPGKPSSLLPTGCEVLSLAETHDDIAELGAGTAKYLGRPAPLSVETPTGKLTEDAIAVIVAALLPENAIICDEALTSARRLFALSEHSRPHDYLMNTGGSIGIGIPLATGAAVACPDRKVITMQADGSGMYTVQGLWTQARENLDILTIILSNRAYAILQAEMVNVGIASYGGNAEKMMRIDQPELDWVALAKGMGVEGVKATTCEEFTKLLQFALAQKGPYVIEAMI
jgi:acetolactate synthase-1/2/3 large subunit